MSRTTARTHPGRLAASILLLVCITGPVGGCGSGDNSVGSLAGPGLAFGTGGTAGSIVPALVGSWFRLAYLPDSAGSVRTLESTLAFNGDGTLTRTLVTRTLSFGFAEQSVSSGTWRATATTVTINVTATNVGGSGGSVPVDSTQTGVGFPGAMTPNPPFGPITRSGGTTTTIIPDSLGTSTGSTTYTYRIETSSTGSTLFLNDTPFVRLNTSAQ